MMGQPRKKSDAGNYYKRQVLSIIKKIDAEDPVLKKIYTFIVHILKLR